MFYAYIQRFNMIGNLQNLILVCENFWHLIDIWPCRATGTMTPHQLLFGNPPSYDLLRVFGCMCFPNQTATAASKLCSRSVACAFLGYPADRRGYICYDMATRWVITSRHVVFTSSSSPFVEHVRPCLVTTEIKKSFQDSPSHRILRHMHKSLNINENKN